MPFETSKPAIRSGVKRAVMQEFKKSRVAIENLSTQLLQRSFDTDFQKDPIDTGLSQRLSAATVSFSEDSIFIDLLIPTDYFMFVLMGWGTNAKYGPRNVILKTKDRIIRGVIEMVVSNMR